MPEGKTIQRRDEEGRAYLSTIVYWQVYDRPSHCLMQAVLVPKDGLKIFLAELKTASPSGGPIRGIFMNPASAANAAWAVAREYLSNIDKVEVEWLFRAGEYSSYDLGHYDTINRVNLNGDAEGRWIHKEFDYYRIRPEDEAKIKQITNIPDVEQDLAKLPKLSRVE